MSERTTGGPSTPSVPWAADVPVSRPIGQRTPPVKIDMGGVVFTPQGLVHDLTEEESEELFTPLYMPQGELPG